RHHQDLAEKGLVTIGAGEGERAAALLSREAACSAHFDLAGHFHMAPGEPPAGLCLDRAGNRKKASENDRARNRDARRSAMHRMLLRIWDRGEVAPTATTGARLGGCAKMRR